MAVTTLAPMAMPMMSTWMFFSWFPMLYCRFVGHVLSNVHVPGTGSIWLDDVQCRGCEKSIEHCPHRLLGTHNCSHRNDVSISCCDRISCDPGSRANLYPFGSDEGDTTVPAGYICVGPIKIPFAIFDNNTLYVSSVQCRIKCTRWSSSYEFTVER